MIMVEYLKFLQDKDKMIKEFKFFHGITIESEGIQGIIRTLRARWEPDLEEDLNTIHAIDAEAELTRILSEEIAREWVEDVDNRIIQFTRNYNGGHRA